MRYLDKEALFFDLDGTLLNSLEGITNSFIYAFEKLKKKLPNEPISNFIGPPLVNSLERFYDDPEEISEIIKCYREYYHNKGVYECKLYDGIKELIYELHEYGYRLYIATSKPTLFAKKIIIEEFGMKDVFIEIYGASDDSRLSSKENILRQAFQSSGEDAVLSLMIGDSIWDKKGAIANNVDFAAVLYGFGERESIFDESNYFNAETVDDVGRFLLKSKT